MAHPTFEWLPDVFKMALGYVTVVGLAFAFFYPISASVPLSAEAFESRIWFESWR